MTRRLLAAAIVLACAGSAFAQDHSQHQQSPPPATAEPVQHEHHQTATGTQPHEPASRYQPPALTDAERAAAFPDLSGHDMSGHMDDDPFVWMVLVDRLEWQQGPDEHAFAWDAKAWFGHDDNRLWLRSEGKGEPPEHGRVEHADIEALWGKPVSPWWDVLFGVRHDFDPGPSQTWAAIGVQGMAPYKFEVQATAYLGEGGQSALQAEVEYDLLLTNRLILQPRIEATAYGRDDDARGIGSGLSEVDVGLRLRYEVRREFAPYIGIEWGRSFGGTSDFARLEGEDVEDTRVVAGVRFWF
jgi:copper resistance protein B